MVNSEHFAKRLEKMLDYYDISAAAFAEAVDVGRSSISHILSGRNKPSLDFVMKVVQTYPEVELYWLLNGKGSFPATPEKVIGSPQSSSSTPKSGALPDNFRKEFKESQNRENKKIRKIIFFYEDGSFETFEN